MKTAGRYSGKIRFLAAAGILLAVLAGCRKENPDVGKTEAETAEADRAGEEILEVCRAYPQPEEDARRDQDTMKEMIGRLGEAGYAAVDSENQIDMTCREQLLSFCEKAGQKEEVQATVAEISWTGECVIWNFQACGGELDVNRQYCSYKKTWEGNYRAQEWKYTEEGYFMFSGACFSEDMYRLAVSTSEEYGAFRVLPLDEQCRRLRQTYLDPVGFVRNNLFLTDWSEEDFGSLNFYDVYDLFYEQVNGGENPYVMAADLGEEAVYQIPEEEFEEVIMKYFSIDRTELREKTVYHPETSSYEYRPRGFDETEYPEYPYSEVLGFTENGDGTITMDAQVVFPYACDSKVYAHKVTVRPGKDGTVQYVSNQVVPAEDNGEAVWHTKRKDQN